jgi:putative pyruvate formate lyase activating enzyme
MIELQNKNVNSIGFVSPTHFTPAIISSLIIAIRKGLNLPLIYNTNTYDSLEIIKLYDGIIDIYLPDLKYYFNEYSFQFSMAKNYFEYAKLNIIEMYKQLGSELIIENGVLKRGLIIRHLILPNDLAGSYEILKFISELDKKINVSLMAQYYPAHKAENFPLLSRSITESEYYKVLDYMEKFGLETGYIQEFESNNYYQPDFENRIKPFNH